ncbi:MAG: hypothetical protein WBJ81_01460 [Rickettsiales bacterium]
MSKDKRTSSMWDAYSDASTSLSGMIGYIFSEFNKNNKQTDNIDIINYVNNFGMDYNYRLDQSLQNLEENLKNNNLPQFTKNKQHTQFLHIYPEKMKYALTLQEDERNKFVTEAMKEQHAYEILLRDSFTDDQEIKSSDRVSGYPPSDTLKTKIAGPWNIDVSSHKLMKDLGENIHFDTLLKALALDNLDSKIYQRRLLFAPIVDVDGFARYDGRIFISTEDNRSAKQMKGTLAHELSHRGMMLSNQYDNSYPYPQSTSETSKNKIFEAVMNQALTNLHQQLIPNIIPPSSVNELASNLERYKESLAPQEEAIINAVSSYLFLKNPYEESKWHNEFVVRLPQIIAELGELPPHIRDCFAPLEEYYKTQITPRWLEYIANHPRKEMLLSNDMDKYHPETILNRSGEDELIAKDQQKLTKPEKLLIAQIQKMQDLIKNGDVNAAHTYLAELQDERVIRASLTTCIEHDSPLFNELFQAIKAPQYLGPQLILAARLNRKEMTEKLLPQITNQYYLAKTVEMALESNNQDLLQKAIHGIKDEWFLSRAKNNYPNNAIITKAITDIIIDEGLNYLKDTHPDKLQTGLRILQSPSVQDFIKDKMKNLEYLINLYESKLTPTLAILENSQFKDWIGKNDYYTTAKLGYLTNLDENQRNIALEVIKNPQFKDWLGDNHYTMDKFSYLVTLDKDQLNTALEILGSKAGEEYISNHAIRLQGLLELSKEQLTSKFNIEFKSQNHISLPVIDILPIESTKLEQQVISYNVTSPSIFNSHNMISEADGQAPDIQQNSASTGNIISQAALAISLAYAAKSMYVVLKKLLVNDGESKASESETKDLDKKLLSLHDQFEALYNKRAEEYKKFPNDLLFEEVNNLKDLQNKAAHNLERLNNFNKLNKSTNIEELQREASIIWRNYKELRKIKELSNSKKLDAIRDVIDSFKKAGVKQNENVNPKVVKMERSVALGARRGGEL